MIIGHVFSGSPHMKPGPAPRGIEDSVTQRILVVDDEPDIRMVARIALRDHYEVVEAGTGEEALSLIQEETPDLVFLDLRMPGMDGWAVLERLREEGKLAEVPVIVVSAHGTPGTSEKALSMGCRGYLTKPFGPRDLLEAIRRYAPAAHTADPDSGGSRV